jgi:glycosyltransferase involved in cell wall biosynthesis
VKRLLLVSYFFPPAAGGGVARALSFARHLPSHGWQVSVICADPEAAPLRDPSRGARLPEGVEVLPVSMPSGLARGRRAVVGAGGGGRPSGLYRAVRAAAAWGLIPDSYAPWRAAGRRAAAARLARGGIDAVLTTSPPDTVHLVGLDLKRAGGPPWVADFRDPWVGLTYKRPPTAWHAARQRGLRDAVLAEADRVLATTRAASGIFRELLGPDRADRVALLPNGWEADVELRTPTGAKATALGPVPPGGGGDLRLVYTGTLWDVPATRACLTGLARARTARPAAPLALDLVGPHESGERRLVARLGLEGVVRFHGLVPYARARALQAAADVLLLLQVHGPGYETAIPGKLYEYLAADRPILAFLPAGEAAELVRAAGGWVVAPGDETAAAEAFARLLRGERPGGASAARRALSEAHRRDRIAADLARLLDGLVLPPAAGDAGAAR